MQFTLNIMFHCWEDELGTPGVAFLHGWIWPVPKTCSQYGHLWSKSLNLWMQHKWQMQQHSVQGGKRAPHQEYFQDLLRTPTTVVVSVVIWVLQWGHHTDSGASVDPKVFASWSFADNGCSPMAWWDALTWSVTSFLAWSKSTSTDSQVIPSTPSVHRAPRGQGRDGISCLVKLNFSLFQPLVLFEIECELKRQNGNFVIKFFLSVDIRKYHRHHQMR